MVLNEILRVGKDRFAITLLKRRFFHLFPVLFSSLFDLVVFSANVEKTARFVSAIEHMFNVVDKADDQQDHIYILERRKE